MNRGVTDIRAAALRLELSVTHTPLSCEDESLFDNVCVIIVWSAER